MLNWYAYTISISYNSWNTLKSQIANQRSTRTVAMTFIVAGRHHEAQDFARANKIYDWAYITSAERLRGTIGARLLYVKGYMRNPNIGEITRMAAERRCKEEWPDSPGKVCPAVVEPIEQTNG